MKKLSHILSLQFHFHDNNHNGAEEKGGSGSFTKFMTRA